MEPKNLESKAISALMPQLGPRINARQIAMQIMEESRAREAEKTKIK